MVEEKTEARQEETGSRIVYRKDPNTGNTTLLYPDGRTLVIGPTTVQSNGVQSAAQSGDVSPARARRLKHQRQGAGKPSVEKLVDADGNDWFIRRLNAGGFDIVTFWSGRDRSGFLNPEMTEADQWVSFRAAVYLACIVTSEMDKTPFFEDWQDAWDQAASEDEADIVVNEILFQKVMEVNPTFKASTQTEQEKKDEANQGETEPPPMTTEEAVSSGPESQSGVISLMKNQSTDSPVESPVASESSKATSSETQEPFNG